MKRILLSAVLIISSLMSYSQELIHQLSSPDGKIKFNLMKCDGRLQYTVLKDGAALIGESELGIRFGSYSTRDMPLADVSESPFRGALEVPFGEEASRPDNYNMLALTFYHPEASIVSEIRLYNEGLAIRFKYSGEEYLSAEEDFTTFDVSAKRLSGYALSTNEASYTSIELNSGKYSSIPPFTCMGGDVALCFHEAGSHGLAARSTVTSSRGIVSFSIRSNLMRSITLPWRYVVWGSDAVDMTRGKYIIYSLNDPFQGDISWIKPGKVFRCEEFETAKLKEAIDFARGLNFQHVLLDAGWYGLGKSQEANPRSNPLEPLPSLDMPEIISYARQNGIGIILYVNKAAWSNYNWKKMMDTYASWGISGIKMGFMDGASIQGIFQIYSAIEYGMEKHIFFNVHDNFYPTGYQRALPNLLTTEGIRGNEHQDNTCEHNTLLPFTRFMAGPADYTFCVKSRNITEAMHWKIVANIQTRVNQMAMATIFQSPLQHLFWYGRPSWYQNIPEEETDYYKDLHTTWDQSLMLAGEPGKYVVMARRKGHNWYIAASNNSKPRTLKVDLGWLNKGVLGVTTYTDDVYKPDSFVAREYNAILGNELVIDLPANGGMVRIVETDSDWDNNLPSQIEQDSLGTDVVVRADAQPGAESLMVYPNPAQDYVYIKGGSSDMEYVLYSSNGAIMAEGRGSQVDIFSLPQGAYALKVSLSGLSRVFRFVKM